MPHIKVTVNNNVGLHARPAALFVETANNFLADIRVSFNGRTVNGKSIINLLILGVDQGSEITISAEGTDADQALLALTTLVNHNFYETV